METDPFLALDVELADASKQLNAYVNAVVEERLDRLNARRPGRRQKLECSDVALFVMQGFRKPFFSRVARWAHTDPQVQRYPALQVKTLDYYRSSVYGVPYYSHFGLPLGRTVNIDGVYVGSDKLGHFLSFGARYYKQYLRWRRHFETPAEATRKTILWGLRLEEQIVGGWTTGVVSFGDLEANYQGLLLSRSLCEGGDTKILAVDEEGLWRLDGELDVTGYVNPDWDEAFNPSFYKKPRWKHIRARVERHCGKLDDPLVRERFERYEARYEPSVNALFMRELERSGALPGRKRFRLQELCASGATHAGR